MADEKKTITELTDILDQDIETLVALRLKAEQDVGSHQRVIEKITNAVGRPIAVYVILGIAVCWVLLSFLDRILGFPIFDAPPFPWLQDLVSLSALVLTAMVLTTQNRQGKLSGQRRHLDLQITLLTERKVSKVIDLLENLRRDLPSMPDRHDPEAQAMKEPVDPHTALSSLNRTLKEAAKEYELEIE